MPATTSPALRRPLVISNPVAELNDITATRSSGSHPRDRNMLAARLARRFSEAKSMVRPWKTTAGLSGLVAAWPARMSMSAIDLMLEARPKSRRRIFGAHAAHLRVQLLCCSLTQLSNAIAPLLGAFHWGPRDGVAGGGPWIAE